MHSRGKLSKATPPFRTTTSQQINNVQKSCAYSYPAKQPGNDCNYKCRRRYMNQMRVERLGMAVEDDSKSITRHAQNKEMIEVADKKCLYNRIKRMVECGLEANEHLLSDIPPKSKMIVKDEEEPELLKVPEKTLIEKSKELKITEEDEERNLVLEKRLQLFIENSEELRCAAMVRRKKEIDDINYKTMQKKEKMNREQKAKKIELANLEISELIKMKNFEKYEEKKNLLKKQQLFRNELNEQVQQKNEIKKQEKELKIIEFNDFKKLNEKFNEEEKLEKLNSIKKKLQMKDEIKQFNEARAKFISQMNDTNIILDTHFQLTMVQNLKDDITDDINTKNQLRRENEMFMKYHEMIGEERKRQNAEMSMMILKQMNEMEELKRSMERKTDEKRQKQVEEGNKALSEQLKSRERLLEQQKELKRKMYEESIKEYEVYLEEEKRLWEEKKQFKWQVKKDLMDQMKSRKDIIEKQRKIDLENHKKCMMEFAEQENLLKKLLDKL